MEKELEKVKDALEDFGKKVVDAMKKGKGEADKVTRIAQIRIEINSLGRQRKDLFLELGELFYNNLLKATAKGQNDIAETVSHIKELDKRVGSLKRTLKAVREDKPVPRRRGRPPKPEAEKSGAKSGKAEASKRRGRPPKNAAAAKDSAPKRRGRPPKNPGAAPGAKKDAAPKRRGRPPKSATKA
jgi:histone H1/5